MTDALKTKASFYLDSELVEKLNKIGKKEDRSASYILNRILKEVLK
jgi:predicted transcriptional regulator